MVEPKLPDEEHSSTRDSHPNGENLTGTGTAQEATDEERETALLPFPLVAIGASAGGLEAYIELFRSLATDTGMAFVVVPHLSPEHESHMAEILAAYTTMQVRQIENDTTPVPNEVFVLPAGEHLTINHGRFHLAPRRSGERLSMPIDGFFRSLASDQKNRAVGIILSGADSDGALGLKTIKGEGGIAIVQDPESARFGEMPRSGILADHVDLILPPAQIATELSRVARQFFLPSLRALEQGEIAPSDEPHYARIVGLLRTLTGVEFRSYKPGTVRRRIARRMVLRRIETLPDYARYLQESREELRNLQEDVLINVTRFFRDPPVFEALRTNILPNLFENRPRDQQVRIWVAGCSTGEEVYSIAICLLESLAGQIQEPPIQIFGTDASDRSIETARAALYPDSIRTEISPERLRRFFVRTDKGYQVTKRVRDLCIFARQNLCNDPPFSRLDLISCRNLLIYLQPEMQRAILTTFHYALRPSGSLLLGRSESVPDSLGLFTPLDRKNKFYAKHGDSSAPMIFAAPLRNVAEVSLHRTGEVLVPRPRTITLDWRSAADQLVVARYGPPGAVVNEQMEVLEVRGRPAPFLTVAPGVPSFSLLRMAQADIVPTLRSAFRRAVESRSPVSEEITVFHERERVEANLEILPLQTGSAGAQQYLVVFVPERKGTAEAEARTAGTRSDSVIPSTSPEQELIKVRRDLTTTRLYLQSLIEERDVRNQELTAAYEEIQSANEELQSTNEELQTAKEELQSTNEELQTVNEELRNRNLALLRTSNDLSNLLNSVNIPVIMLGSDLTIRQFTPPAERLMALRAVDIGRPIGEIRLNLVLDDIEPLLHEVLDALVTKELDVQDRSGRWHLLRLRPYRTADNKIEGVVIVLLDVDEMRRSKIELEQARDFAQTVVEAVHIPVVVLDREMRVRTGNAAFRALSKIGPADLEHRSFPELLTLLWAWPDLRPALQELLDDHRTGVLNSEHETADGARQSFHLVARAVQAESEPAILVVMEDVTNRKQAARVLEAEREQLTDQVRSASEVLGRTREELRALAGRLFTSQEEERRRVARELHDDVSQRLAALGMELDRLGEHLPSDPNEVRQRLQVAEDRTAQLADDVRNISLRLHPSAIDHLGLPAALRALVTEFGEREHMLSAFRSSDVPDQLPLEIAGALYRITQEALRNVSKHAGRTHVKVLLERADSQLRLVIRDFGEGFDMKESQLRSLGFISMAERARLVGGVFSVNSALGEGTTVSVVVPLSDKADSQI